MTAAIEEFESVKDIYEKFQVISNNIKNPKCEICITPSDTDAKVYIALNITFSFPHNYPKNAPIIIFKPTNSMKQTLQSFYHTFKENTDMLNLTKTQKQNLMNTINEYLNENQNSEVLFDLISLIQEWIDENNSPPTNDNFDHMNDNNSHNKQAIDIKEEKDNINNKPRILMLHAYKQNGKIFRQRSKNYVKLLLNKFDLSFPNAPFKLNGTNDCPNPFCWYKYPQVIDNNNNNDDGQTNLSNLLCNHKIVEYIGFWELLKYFYKYLIDECYENNSQFIAIISFSQGSTLTVILLWLASLCNDEFEKLIMLPHIEIMNKIGLYGLFKKYGQVFNKYLNIKACVLMSGHLYPLPKQLELSYLQFVMYCDDKNESEKEIKQKNNGIKWNKLKCKSLHTMSPNDKWVTVDKSQDLLALFENTEIIEHPNGHSVYNNKYVAEWIIKCLSVT